MYRKFYGLAEAPFNLTPDSRFLFLSRRHREALGALLYGIDERKGFIVLTGAIGAGKTTICRALLTELDAEGTRVAVILNSYLNELELLQSVNGEFGLASNLDSKKALIDELNRFLLKEHEEGRTVVMVIDEAQHLSREVLEQIRMLSNLETEKDKLIQIVLIGQPELDDILRREDLKQLNQRVTVRYHLTPLTAEEMAQYIRHRLFVARARIEIEFTPEALKIIYGYSNGVPRLINLVCDRALLIGYVEAVYTIDEKIARNAVSELSVGSQARAESPAPRGKPAREGDRRGVSPAVVGALFTVVGLLAVGGSAGLGILLANQQPSVSSSDRSAATAIPAPTPAPAPTRTPRLAPSATPPATEAVRVAQLTTGTAQASGPGTVDPRVESAPRILTPKSRAWVYQERDIGFGYPVKFIQVDEERHALAGAFLTSLAAWNVVVDVDRFRQSDEASCKTIMAHFSNGDKPLRLVALDGKTLIEAFDFDVPLLLEIEQKAAEPEAGSFAPYVVLLRVQGEALVIADPFRGLRTVRRELLSRLVSGITAPYLDTKNWGSLRKGDESETVLALQQFLSDKRFLGRKPNKRYDASLELALKAFQKYHNLQPTGELDAMTLLMLAAQTEQARPHLFQSESDRL